MVAPSPAGEPTPANVLPLAPRGNVPDALELPGATAVRHRVMARRATGSALLDEQTRGVRPEERPKTELEALIAQAEAHRGLLWFDLAGPSRGVVRLLTPFKRLQRRLMRSYLVQQDAFNTYAIEFLRVLAAAQRRQDVCVCEAAGSEAEGPAPRQQALLLRVSTHQDAVHPGVERLVRAQPAPGLAAFFEGCRLVVGAGQGVTDALSLLRQHGLDALALSRCPSCQGAARRAGLRVAEGEATDYFAGRNAFGADGVVLSHVVEHMAPAETVGLLRRVRAVLPPGGPLAIVNATTSAHLDLALGRGRTGEDLRLYPVEFLSKLAAASGFDVLGLSSI